MSNNNLFKALSCPTRIKILKLLIKKEIHLSGLARELKISVPVTSRHIKILEKAGLLNKKIIGNVHIYSVKTNILEKLLDPFIEVNSIKIDKNIKLSDALKQLPDIEIQKVGKNEFIKSINNENGFFIYEIDGKLPKKPINNFILKNDISLELKKIIPIKKKKIDIKIKEK